MSKDKLAIEGGTPVRTTPLPTVANITGRNFGEEEMANIQEVMRTGELFMYDGHFVTDFENDFKKLMNMKHAVACTSGTAALHIAVGTINPNPGDEIITAPITDMGTLIGILLQNCVPVFADLDPETYTLLPESVESLITEKTKAILPVHLFGHPADMDPLMDIANRHGLRMIEDCCQAYLTEYKGRTVGTIGDFGCFSLQQTKHMTSGDGGIVVMNDDKFEERARLFGDKGWPRHPGAPRGYLFLGPNYRMNEITAAIACAQVQKVRSVVERRQKVAEKMSARLAEAPGVKLPVTKEGCKHTWWLYPITIDESILNCTPKEFAAAVSAEGITADQGYIGQPIYMSPVFQDAETYGDLGCPFTCPYSNPREYKLNDCPNTVEILRTIITLTCNEFFTDADIDDIATAVIKVARRFEA